MLDLLFNIWHYIAMPNTTTSNTHQRRRSASASRPPTEISVPTGSNNAWYPVTPATIPTRSEYRATRRAREERIRQLAREGNRLRDACADLSLRLNSLNLGQGYDNSYYNYDSDSITSNDSRSINSGGSSTVSSGDSSSSSTTGPSREESRRSFFRNRANSFGGAIAALEAANQVIPNLTENLRRRVRNSITRQ